MPSDARLHARHCVEAIADVIGDEIILAKPLLSLDLSACQFDESAWESEGKSVDLILSFPIQHSHIPLSGTVTSNSSHLMEIRFNELTREQRCALEKSIRIDHERKTRR